MVVVSPNLFCEDSTSQQVLSTLIDSGNSDIATAFLNLAKVAAIVSV